MSSSIPLVSVILCTHNPRPEYICRTLRALAAQTLDSHKWELIIVDNCSSDKLAEWLEPPNDFHATIVREDTLGLTFARLHGIRLARAELLVFVDDDNVLDPDYLNQALEIAIERPYIGAFCGNITGEFESEPPAHWNGLLGWLAVIHTDKDIWGNSYKLEQLPVGAGLCLRRSIALHYAHEVGINPRRLLLDRRGTHLASGGDTDMVLTAIDLGFGVGVFRHLHLIHLISSQRLSLAYLLRLAEAMAFSQIIRARLNRGPAKPAPNWRRRALDFAKFPLLPRFQRQLLKARLRGEAKARRELLHVSAPA